jgi:hypothetical protein
MAEGTMFQRGAGVLDWACPSDQRKDPVQERNSEKHQQKESDVGDW